jgi:beta-lactamase class A
MQRSSFVSALTAAVVLPNVPRADAASIAASGRLAALETHAGGRLGVHALETTGRKTLGHRAGERFPMCSTFKFLLTAAVLARADRGEEHLGRPISYGKRDLLAYAPITTAHVAQGHMTVEALCAATVSYSDNTAADLLLGTIGGPAGVTRFARTIGDGVTRLDRTEPTLNTAIPGDPRDTTMPASATADLERVLLGNALSHASRARLEGWMTDCRTGVDCIRAGIPAGWRVGDKTGSGDNNTRNDIAILRPPAGAPILVAAYLTGARVSAADRDAALAEVGRIVLSSLAGA